MNVPSLLMIAIYVRQDHFYLVDVEEPPKYESHEYEVMPQLFL